MRCNAVLATILLAWIGMRAYSAEATEESREGLVLEYRFDNNLEDTSGGGHQGRMNGQPAYVAGHVKNCLAFDGKATYVDSGTSLPRLKSTFTVECWVKPAQTQARYADLFGNHSHDFRGFALQQDGDQPNRYYFTYGDGKTWVYSKTIALKADEWQHVSYQPSVTSGGRKMDMNKAELSYLVLETNGGAASMPSSAGGDSVQKADHLRPSQVMPLDGEWLLATDPKNVGRDRHWWKGPVSDAKHTKVPWIIQDAFPGYHGVAWYWRDFIAPSNPAQQGRYLLRFWAVDYKADVWLNGAPVGGHEGGETPFVLDVTDQIKPGAVNRMAVRVLNPTHEPIDGMTLNQTPHRAKVIPYSAGASYNHGGIVDSVELATVPAVYVDDLYLRADPKAGSIRVQLTLRNTAQNDTKADIEVAAAPATSGETIDIARLDRVLPVSSSLIKVDLRVVNPRPWELSDPALYRVTARVWASGSRCCDEASARCGFRDFRFENGYFRLNGHRVYVRSSHTCNATPVGQQVPHDPALFERDLLYMKTMGFNMIRFIWGGATRRQLDLCDEMGLMVYAESAASNPMQDSPKMIERFDRSVAEMIRRDRNHPSVVMWGLLNETHDGPVFRHATEMLPLVRSLDETRVVVLNSGRWDGQLDIGTLSNPGSTGWYGYLGGERPGGPASPMSSPGGYCVRMGDVHAYPRVPQTADTTRFFRTLGADTKHVFLTEYGIGSAVDLWRVVRHFEQLRKEDAEDALYYRDKLNRFLADWERWRLAEVFTGPEEFFAQSLRKMAGQRTLGLNAIRSNPNLVGHSVTGMMDHVNCGEGLFTLFRELKPGTTDAMFEALAPLRMCLFVEPTHIYRGQKVRVEAVLANEDVLPPGEYPVRLQVIGPAMSRVFERKVTVTAPDRTGNQEPPFAIPFFADDIAVHGPAGQYRFLATLERGGAPTGGQTEFHVTDAAQMPPVEAEVVLWGDDAQLAKWLSEHGIRVRGFSLEPPKAREAILVAGRPAASGIEQAWRELAARIARGSTAVFLSPEVFKRADKPLAWLPLKNKGALSSIYGWLYLKDEWAKAHPIFDGLPAGGLMDYTYYREIIPDLTLAGQDPPAEAVAGAIKASQDYASGLMVSVHYLGSGRFILNTLLIRENLGRHPAAERLLRNMLRYASSDAGKPMAEPPADFGAQLNTMGYPL
jgi:hypothetical protein